MEQRPFLEAESRSPNQEILRPLWIANVHYYVHKVLAVVPILSQVNPVHNLIHYF